MYVCMYALHTSVFIYLIIHLSSSPHGKNVARTVEVGAYKTNELKALIRYYQEKRWLNPGM